MKKENETAQSGFQYIKITLWLFQFIGNFSCP